MLYRAGSVDLSNKISMNLLRTPISNTKLSRVNKDKENVREFKAKKKKISQFNNSKTMMRLTSLITRLAPRNKAWAKYDISC